MKRTNLARRGLELAALTAVLVTGACTALDGAGVETMGAGASEMSQNSATEKLQETNGGTEAVNSDAEAEEPGAGTDPKSGESGGTSDDQKTEPGADEWKANHEKVRGIYVTGPMAGSAGMGFDEIQFDYVRFPIGADADAADYGVDLDTYTREQAITGFLSYAAERLHEKNIVFGADVFGTIIGSETDVERVGQNYETIGEIVDVLSPMVYPSHYANEVFGLDVPDAHPYETVLSALQGSARELETVDEADRAVVRPWLQSFTASWITGHISYGGEEIRQQIQAVYDAGYEEWILWNASNRYPAEGLLSAQE